MNREEYRKRVMDIDDLIIGAYKAGTRVGLLGMSAGFAMSVMGADSNNLRLYHDGFALSVSGLKLAIGSYVVFSPYIVWRTHNMQREISERSGGLESKVEPKEKPKDPKN